MYSQHDLELLREYIFGVIKERDNVKKINDAVLPRISVGLDHHDLNNNKTSMESQFMNAIIRLCKLFLLQNGNRNVFLVLQLRKDLKNNEDAIAARALLGMVATDIEHQKGAIEYDLNVAPQQFSKLF
ncbi:unnamed protein product [Adineta steineri]|uniref:Uncharacterized protein n=1 Tax=Adineta steineri TaxID=433720 RepID=A0A819VPZ5_9BILA|nr:unnamed protein product [Adineta steineri]